MREIRRAIVVVGSINMDLVSRVSVIPRAGETIFGHNFTTHGGGKGANQAVGVARLGYPVKLIGMVGRDSFGERLRDQLGREGVSTQEIGESEEATGSATILVDDEGQNCIVVTPGANGSLTPALLSEKRDVLQSAGVVLAQLEIPVETVLRLVEMCQGMRVPLILDPAPAVKLPPEILRGVTWFTPNETEAEFYSGDAESEMATLERLKRLGVSGLILKRGSAGCLLVEEDGSSHRIAARAVHAIDTTAAGDAFNAAFAVALMRGNRPSECAQFATMAAAISVTRLGAQPSLATDREVEEALGRHRFGG